MAIYSLEDDSNIRELMVYTLDLAGFEVADTGIGVPPEDAERIFEQFVQLDDYREGTGIGLTVARSLGRRLGGDVFLDTSYTFGARFIFSLPHTDA